MRRVTRDQSATLRESTVPEAGERARARARARARSILRYRRDSIPPLQVRVFPLRGITPRGEGGEDAFLFLLSLTNAATASSA